MKINYRPTDKQQNPTVEHGFKVDYAAAKRTGYRLRWYFLLLLIFLPLVLVLWAVLRPQLLILAPGLISTEPLELRSPANARLVSIAVTKGQSIDNGSLLLQLQDPQLDAQITELQQQLAQLAQPVAVSDQAILQQRQASISIAEQAVTQQSEYLSSYQNFKRSGLVLTHEMAAVQQTLTNAKLALEQAKTDTLQLSQQQQIQQLAGSVAQARRQLQQALAQLQAQQQQLAITALSAGRVIDIQVKAGEFVQQNQPLLLLSNRPAPVIFGYLEPKYLDYAKVGGNATVRLPNGDKVRAAITEPAQLLERLPAKLAGPFDGEQAVLKLTLTPEQPMTDIEGVPVEISFDWLWL